MVIDVNTLGPISDHVVRALVVNYPVTSGRDIDDVDLVAGRGRAGLLGVLVGGAIREDLGPIHGQPAKMGTVIRHDVRGLTGIRIGGVLARRIRGGSSTLA